jgi:DNA-binding CsgD family transcriptional regulator
MPSVNDDVFLAAVDRLLAVDTVEALRLCITQDLRILLSFGSVVGGSGRVTDDKVVLDLMVADNVSEEHVESVRDGSAGVNSQILARWLERQTPVAAEFTAGCELITREALLDAWRLNLVNVLAHGYYSARDQSITYFSMHRLARPAGEAQQRLIAHLMPHLHCAMNRVRGSHAAAPADDPPLPGRQEEIAYWISQGKTNWEIGRILGTSEGNVKYHLSNLMRRYCVSSRTALAFKLNSTATST